MLRDALLLFCPYELPLTASESSPQSLVAGGSLSLRHRKPCQTWSSSAKDQASFSSLLSTIFPKSHAPLSPPWASLMSSSLQKPTHGKGVVFKQPSFLFWTQDSTNSWLAFWNGTGKLKEDKNPLNTSIIHVSTDILQHLYWSSVPRPLPTKTQASSLSAKGHFNLLADVLWAHTMAANSVKHAECVEREGVMTLDVCIHFAGRGIAKVKLTSFLERLSLQIPKTKTAVAQLTTRQQKRSLQERTTALSLITHGDFIRILVLRSKLRWQEIVLKPAFKKEKLQNCCVGTGAPKSSLLSQLNCLPSGLQLVLIIFNIQRKKGP